MKSVVFQKAPKQSLGFSLLEILVVIVILGILIALVAPQIIGQSDKARITAAKTDLVTISNALDLYKLDNHTYPTTEQGIKALIEKPSTDPKPANWVDGGYLKKFPKDPWGREYQYISPGTDSRAFDLYSFGSDGKEGGEGYAADITNW